MVGSSGAAGSMLPDISRDGLEGNDELSNNFFIFIFKVQPCPKRGAHDWSSCPYAHPKEKARRRDPRVYRYVSTPCPESLKGVNCGRGVDCPYAHSVYEYWLHPARFRTQMCKKGNQCNRTLCFFAHSASELRFPDSQDDLEAAAVDAAAASATATPFTLCTPVSSSLSNNQAYTYTGGSVSMLPTTASGSSFGMQNLVGAGQVCSDGSNGGLGLLQVPAAAALPQQQVVLQQDELGSCYRGSDSTLQIPGVGMQRADSHPSDSLPRLGSDVSAMAAHPAGWLQMAAAAQLSGNQIMSQISRPFGQQQVPMQLQTPQAATLMPTPVLSMDAAYAAATGMAPAQDFQRNAAQPNVYVMANPASLTLNTADVLSAGMAGISLASGSSSGMAITNEQYLAALNAANTGRPYDMSMLQQTAATPSRNENMLLLQQLQHHQQLQHQQQLQQQLIKLSSGGSAVSRESSGGVYLGGAQMQGTGSWVRMV